MELKELLAEGLIGNMSHPFGAKPVSKAENVGDNKHQQDDRKPKEEKKGTGAAFAKYLESVEKEKEPEEEPEDGEDKMEVKNPVKEHANSMKTILEKVKLMESEEWTPPWKKDEEKEEDKSEAKEDDKEDDKEDEVKECVVKVQLKSGKVGSKTFESRVAALTWLNENASKFQAATVVEMFEGKGCAGMSKKQKAAVAISKEKEKKGKK